MEKIVKDLVCDLQNIHGKLLGKHLSQFPSEERVKEVCKPGNGDKTCRYLTMGTRGWSCAKASSLKKTLDEKVVTNQMHAKGDNCDGLVGEILKYAEALKSMQTSYSESMPSFEDNGVLKEIYVKDGMLYITAIWDQNGEQTYSYSLDYIDIDLIAYSITFGISGLGTFGGRTTVYLE